MYLSLFVVQPQSTRKQALYLGYSTDLSGFSALRPLPFNMRHGSRFQPLVN